VFGVCGPPTKYGTSPMLLNKASCHKNNYNNNNLSFFVCRKFKTGRSPHSTPAHSTDLEWDHLPEMVIQRSIVRRDGDSITQRNDDVVSGTSGSSKDSLEWDSQDDNIKM